MQGGEREGGRRRGSLRTRSRSLLPTPRYDGVTSVSRGPTSVAGRGEVLQASAGPGVGQNRYVPDAARIAVRRGRAARHPLRLGRLLGHRRTRTSG
jgi:hypothetical protein